MTPLASGAADARHQSVLAEMRPGQTATVLGVDVSGEVGERLMEMGVTPGTTIKLVRRGLWGDPLQVRVRGFMMTLRRAQARDIRVGL